MVAVVVLWETLSHAIDSYTGLSPAAFFTAVVIAASIYHLVASFLVSPLPPPRNREFVPVESEPLPPPVQLGDNSKEELKAYDGSDLKKIFDVTQSREMMETRAREPLQSIRKPIKISMDTASHWPHQELGLVKPMEEMVPASANTSAAAGNTLGQARPQMMERRARPQKEKALNCPRCNSTNTKFCYYNNYSLTQPIYFCKTCRKYWIEGGSLRNVPVGGGSRKNKRPSSSTTATQATATAGGATTHSTTAATAVSPSSVISSQAIRKLMHEAQDLNLAFNHRTVPVPEFSFPSLESSTMRSTNGDANGSFGTISAMELLRSGIGSGSLATGFVPLPVPEYTTGFVLQHEFTPPHTLAFSLDSEVGVGDGGGASAVGGGFVGIRSVQETGNGSRLLFPFGDFKPVISSGASEYESKKDLFCNAMLGDGSGATGGGATGDGVRGNGAS